MLSSRAVCHRALQVPLKEVNNILAEYSTKLESSKKVLNIFQAVAGVMVFFSLVVIVLTPLLYVIFHTVDLVLAICVPLFITSTTAHAVVTSIIENKEEEINLLSKTVEDYGKTKQENKLPEDLSTIDFKESEKHFFVSNLPYKGSLPVGYKFVRYYNYANIQEMIKTNTVSFLENARCVVIERCSNQCYETIEQRPLSG